MKTSTTVFLALGIILILLSISSVGCPGNIEGISPKAKLKLTKAIITDLSIAIEAYYTDNGFFPSTEQGLSALSIKPTVPPIPPIWNGPYAAEGEMNADIWGNPWHYRHPSTHGMKYDLWSSGPDGKDGTDDDITNWK